MGIKNLLQAGESQKTIRKTYVQRGPCIWHCYAMRAYLRLARAPYLSARGQAGTPLMRVNLFGWIQTMLSSAA